MDTATVTPTAPTSAPVASTSSAAPATSAPSTPQTPDQRPSFAQAFANDAAQHPAETSTPTELPTTQAVETPADPSAIHPSTEPKVGTPPEHTWPTILDNARAKERAAATAEFDRDYGWAKELPREKLVEWSGIASLMASDPPAFLEKYFAETVQHPTFGPHVKSWAAKTLATRVQADTMPGPDVSIVDQQGNVTGATYSAEQLAKRDAWRDRQADQRFDQRLQPFEQERKQKQDEAHAAETTKQINANVDQSVARIDQILDGKANEYGPLIADLILKDKALDPIDAALQIRKSHILPKLQGQANAQVLEDLKTKAAAQGMNPSRAGVATTHKPTSFLDKSLEW